MRLLTFCHQGREMVGALSPDGERVFPLEELGHPVASMEDLIRQSTPQLLQELDAQVRSRDGGGLAYASVQKMAPIPRPRQDILCLGINYMDHAEESTSPSGSTGPRGMARCCPTMPTWTPASTMRRSWG